MKTFFLFVFLINAGIISGCQGMPVMDAFSVANIFNEATKKQPEKPAEVVAENAYDEEKFYDSSHNWNNPKTTKVEPVKITSEPKKSKSKQITKEEPEKDINLPWPLLFIVLISGLMYFINTVRYYRQRNEK